jgi:hypothetical protein
LLVRLNIDPGSHRAGNNPTIYASYFELEKKIKILTVLGVVISLVPLLNNCRGSDRVQSMIARCNAVPVKISSTVIPIRGMQNGLCNRRWPDNRARPYLMNHERFWQNAEHAKAVSSLAYSTEHKNKIAFLLKYFRLLTKKNRRE